MQNKERSQEWHKEYHQKNKLKAKEYHKNYYKLYKEKLDACSLKWRIENKDKVKENQLKYCYNITIKDYNRMFAEQEGKCAICGIHQRELRKALHVDHDHETKNIRGLLCKKCNSLLGYVNDNEDILNNAIEYLIKKNNE